jgi:hypothetical protein
LLFTYRLKIGLENNKTGAGLPSERNTQIKKVLEVQKEKQRKIN